MHLADRDEPEVPERAARSGLPVCIEVGDKPNMCGLRDVASF